MSTISVVNGSNIFGRYLIASLARRHSVRLLDFRPYRHSVYQLQREMKQHNASFEKHQISTADSLSKGIQGSDTVIYINHDYLSLTSDKDDVLKVAAQRAKRQGVHKFISLSPVEFDHFFDDPSDSESIHTPIERRRLEAEEYARQGEITIRSQFPEMTNLRVNLLYGEQSYALRYLTQCMLRGVVPENYNLDHYLTTFYPIHMMDVLHAVEHAIQNTESVSGKNFAIIGKEGKNLGKLLQALEAYVGQKPKKVPVIHLTNLFWRWLVGQTHDKNILDMFLYFQKHDGDFTKESGASYFEANGLEFKAPLFSETYAPNSTIPDYNTPLMMDYKRIEVD